MPIGQSVRLVRVEIENGTVGVDVCDDPVLHIGGGVRRAADTAAELARLEAVPANLVGAPDPNDPSVLVVRGPQLGTDGPQGVLGYELGLRLPAALDFEVVVRGNGHVTVARRTGAVRVTTGRGDLRFEHCQGGAVAKTGRGVVLAFGMGGSIDLESAHGDMQVFVPKPGELLRLRTGQGTIQCFLPKATGFVCNARTETGRVGGAFGLPTETTTRFGMAMTGQHGDGRTKVVLVTGSGYIALQQHEG
ncbi:MAG: hypothetical protein JNK49_07725 [Planctomycetes bacterium]|nr:hypothetical protein [Planctomycetota bacterium]